MNQKVFQIAVGLVILLGWGILGVHGLPTSRLEGLVNFPNPFDSRLTKTTIAYQLRSEARVSIHLFDLTGGRVREWTFFPGEAGARAGDNRVEWDGTNASGDKVAAGGYMCQVLVEEENGVVQGVRKVGVVR